jgi:hypothetical protein
VVFERFAKLADADYEVGRSTLMGQVSLARSRRITYAMVALLTTDVLAMHPTAGSVSISMVNADSKVSYALPH